MGVNGIKDESIYQFGVHDKKTGNTVNKKDNDDLDKNAFLHLLTTQLANQDPLDPMDDREFIAQLAQFSSLEQMNNLNEKTIDLIDAVDVLNVNQLQANSMILKELVILKKMLADELGIELNENGQLKPEKPGKPEENEDIKEVEKNNIYKDQDIKSRMMAYNLMK